MSIEFIKKAKKNSATGEDNTRQIVSSMLAEIESGGEQKCREYALKLDNYSGNIVVTPEEIEAAGKMLSQRMKDDVQFAYERVYNFALKQRATLVDFETELSPGLWAGQRQIPMSAAGCYVPGGRYSHVASAVMSVATAKAAGVAWGRRVSETRPVALPRRFAFSRIVSTWLPSASTPITSEPV